MLSDGEFRTLLAGLERPWDGYRRVRRGVKKRLRRHMRSLGCTTVDQYLTRLFADPGVMRCCDRCLRVTISRFFRDRQLWSDLHDRILPGLAQRFGPSLRIWSAGCAGGEEPYSLAMLWNELGRPVPLELLATDADAGCLARARAGVYPRSSLKEAPAPIKETYFALRRGGRQYRILGHRLPTVCWRQHDLLDAPPVTGPVHLILLRNNLLTYYQGEVLIDAVSRIVRILAPGGGLVTGSGELLPHDTLPLVRDADCPWLYWETQ